MSLHLCQTLMNRRVTLLNSVPPPQHSMLWLLPGMVVFSCISFSVCCHDHAKLFNRYIVMFIYFVFYIQFILWNLNLSFTHTDVCQYSELTNIFIFLYLFHIFNRWKFAILIYSIPTHCHQTEADWNNSLVPCLHNSFLL